MKGVLYVVIALCVLAGMSSAQVGPFSPPDLIWNNNRAICPSCQMETTVSSVPPAGTRLVCLHCQKSYVWQPSQCCVCNGKGEVDCSYATFQKVVDRGWTKYGSVTLSLNGGKPKTYLSGDAADGLVGLPKFPIEWGRNTVLFAYECDWYRNEQIYCPFGLTAAVPCPICYGKSGVIYSVPNGEGDILVQPAIPSQLSLGWWIRPDRLKHSISRDEWLVAKQKFGTEFATSNEGSATEYYYKCDQCKAANGFVLAKCPICDGTGKVKCTEPGCQGGTVGLPSS